MLALGRNCFRGGIAQSWKRHLVEFEPLSASVIMRSPLSFWRSLLDYVRRIDIAVAIGGLLLGRVKLGLYERVQPVLGTKVLQHGQRGSCDGRGTRRTGMPELVLMPAPVMTTTFRAFHRVFAMSCNNGSQPGSTWVVGIAFGRPINGTSENGSRGVSRRSGAIQKPTAI
jgi:hypothetical protein